MAKRKNPAIAADPEVVLAFKKEQAENDIEEITGWLKDVRIELYQRTIKTGKLIQCYKILGDTDKMCKTARELIRLVKSQSYKIKKMRNPKHADAISKHFHTAYITLAPYSFMHFLVCMEWNYPQSMKFYSNRICVMGEWAHQLERLEMGELDLLGLSAPPRSGKEQPLSSKILTPDGWKTMGDMKIGQKVIGADGKSCDVVGIFPQGYKDIYRVTFDDKTFVDCGINHLWEVQTRDDRKNKRSRVVSTEKLMENLYVENGTRKNYTIEYVQPVEFNSKLTPNDLHPYVLGALIGDGHLRKHSTGFASKDMDILGRLLKFLPDTDTVVKCKGDNCDYSIVKKDMSIRNKKGHMVQPKTLKKLCEYGLTGCRSEDKFIPEKYLYASKNERIELLKGLMDTDGYAGGSSNTYNEFTTVSPKLRDEFVELVRSLGGRVTVSEKMGSYKKQTGEKVICQKVYRITFNLEINPFSCQRKRDNFLPRAKRKNKYIVSIERVRKEECQCIYVNHPRHLYVTDGYNLTHNTGIGELFLSWIIGRHPDKSTLFATHTNGMAVKAMGDVYNLITDPRRGWSEVFPNITVEKSQEYLWMDLSPKDTPNTYKTIYFRGIDGSFAGVLEASAYIYCDDLIRDITEAMNPDRLENAWTKYGTDISQRRVDDTVKELHIATRWSTRDVLSRLEEENEDNPRAKFIKVPGLNEQGESNFMFPHRPMTKEHFEKLRSKMDEVSFECIIQQNPIERDGLLFTAGDLKTHEFDFLPDENPDEVVFYCDVAFGGGDFLSMPIASVYDMDGFINEVVHHNGTKEITVPLVVDAIIRNKCTRGEFEGNNGGNMYADLVQEELKRRGYRCAVSSRRAPTNKSKLDRILACVPEIKGNITDGSGYTLHFRSDKSIVRDEMYRMYKKHLMAFNQSAKYQGKQKDDAADSTAGLVTNVLSENAHMGRISTFSRSLLF